MVFSLAGLSLANDAQRGHLVLDLFGPLDSSVLQVATELVSRLPPGGPASCLVQDNRPDAKAESNGEQALLSQLLPALQHAGVRQWRWVCTSSLRSHHLASQVARRLPAAAFTLFFDAAHAAAWRWPPLPSSASQPSSGC